MKYASRLALLSSMAFFGGVYLCAGGAPPQAAAPQAASAQATNAGALRFTVLRGQHVLGPSIEMTAAEANCAVTGTGDSAGVRCRPVGVTQKNAYNYNVTLIAEADGSAYVIACRIGLVSNTWCKGLAEGRILRGALANGHLTVMDGDTPRQYLVLGMAQIGPLDTDEPVAAPAAKGKKGRAAAPAGCTRGGTRRAAPLRQRSAAAGQPAFATLGDMCRPRASRQQPPTRPTPPACRSSPSPRARTSTSTANSWAARRR